MLRRRYKRRYLSVIHVGECTASVNAITKRFYELFGTVAAEKAAIRLIRQGANESIIQCSLDQIERVLVAITLVDPPAVTIAMSGTIRQLQRRRQKEHSHSKTKVN